MTREIPPIQVDRCSGSAREAAVAGRFYPGEPDVLREQVEQLLRRPPSAPAPHQALAVITPHAGYPYSGPLAGRTFASVEVPRYAVVICPNHTGKGARKSVWGGGDWHIPGATIPMAEILAQRLVGHAGLVRDREAHLHEHAIEVELPLLHARQQDLSVVPICLGRLSLEECLDIGAILAREIQSIGPPHSVLLVASTDLSHYLPVAAAARFDQMAIDRMLAIDPEGLYEVVLREDISMCGFIPTTIVLAAARGLGASRAALVGYTHSGEYSGECHRVVGYAGVTVV